jgi:hypothetical protein
MNVERFVVAVLVGLTTLGVARAQDAVMPPPAAAQGAPNAPLTVEVMPARTNQYEVPGVTSWIRRDCNCDKSCYGPVGGDGGIGTEVYFRSGPAIPIGNSEILSRNLVTGFTVAGGVKTLFFDKDYRAAWVVDTGVVNTFNSGGGVKPAELFTLNVLVPNPVAGGKSIRQLVPVGIRNFNQTFASLGFGREWWLGGANAQECGPQWRVGLDGGGRYGSGSMELDRTLPHRTDVMGAAFVASWINYEFPWYNTRVQLGFRGEWSYTWSDILQRATDAQLLHLLGTAGIRY